MPLLQQVLPKLPRLNFIPLVKYSMSSAGSTIDSFYFKSNFTEEEETKILNTLNDSNSDQLSKFRVSQNRIKNINSWKIKKGPFRSLNEVLEVKGLGEKLLHKLCEDIVNENYTLNEQLEINSSSVKAKRIKQIVTPIINGNILNSLTSGVGIHLSPIGISWAKINREGNKLVGWNFEDFSELPKKMLPDDTFTQSINIVRRIPPSDVYIFETSPSLGPQSQSQTSVTSAYVQQLELSAMLLALLNTSLNHNVTLQNNNSESPQKSIENRVFYLRSRISARLFNKLVGQERVAAITTINDLLLETEKETNLSPCTPITVEQQLKNAFNSQSPANKELLGQALMLIISFMDLCVYKNPVSLAVLNVNRTNKK